jgi:hypothetical protein
MANPDISVSTGHGFWYRLLTLSTLISRKQLLISKFLEFLKGTGTLLHGLHLYDGYHQKGTGLRESQRSL